MPNPRYVKNLTDFGTKELGNVLSRLSNARPAGTEIPLAAQIPGHKRLPDSKIPFMAGDRVQIAEGPDKGKIGQIVGRYPTLGNAFYVAGVGVDKIVNPIQGKAAAGDSYDPVVDNFKVFDFHSLRLVSKIRGEDGKDEDVVIHSVELGPERYDARSNTYPRLRYAKHDTDITIPFPLEEAKPIESSLTTSAPATDLRTHFVTAAYLNPLPIGAVDQIINPNNRFKRSRYAKKLSETQAAKAQPPKMPVPPKTKKLLAELAAMPKPAPVPFTTEMEDFLGAEIKKGLAKRAQEQEEALNNIR